MRRFVSFSVSALLAVSLVLPYLTMPCYAYADDQEDVSRAPDAVEPPPAVSSIPLSDVLGGVDGYSGGGIETGGAAAPDAGVSGGAGRAPEEGGSGLEEARSPGEAEEEAVEAPPEVGSLDLLPALVRSVGSNVQSPLVWVANVISQYIAYNPSNSERYYTHFTLASIYSALYGYQTINGSQQLVSYYSGGIAGMLSSSNNYLYSILGGQLDIYNRLDSFRYVVDSGMLALDKRIRDIGSTSSSWLSGTWNVDTLTLGQLLGSIYNAFYSSNQLSRIGNTYLEQVSDQLATSFGMTGVSSGSHSLALISALIHNQVAAASNRLSTSLPMTGVIDGAYSVAVISALIHNQVAAAASRLTSSMNMVGIVPGTYSIGVISSLSFNKLAGILSASSYSGALSGTQREVHTIADLLSGLWEKETLSTSLLVGSYSVPYVGSATALGLIHNQLYSLRSDLRDLSFDVDFPALDAVHAKLDGIMDLMRLGLAVDVADAILGDLDFSGLSALAADVSGALSSAFPFCVPALLKQVLGLVQAEAAPPSFHFEIMGAPLDFDFSGYQGFADVTGWVCRLTLVLVLLAASPRFVVGSKVGGA